MVERLFLAVPRGCLQFVIVVFPDHTHLLFSVCNNIYESGDGMIVYVEIISCTKVWVGMVAGIELLSFVSTVMLPNALRGSVRN